MKKWEVSLISDVPSYQVVCKDFRSQAAARRYMKKSLGPDSEFYCAVITRPDELEISTFYWNGERIIRWDKPYVLSSRQAREIGDET